jgi:hypothetical protein
MMASSLLPAVLVVVQVEVVVAADILERASSLAKATKRSLCTGEEVKRIQSCLF